MDAYIHKIIHDFPERITGTAPSPAADCLYQICDASNARPLNDTHAFALRHTMAQLLFASTRMHQDIQVVVSFLTTCIRSPDEDDWGN